jgi:hypothetical protein
LNNLVFVFLFVLFVIIRNILAIKNQPGGRKRGAKRNLSASEIRGAKAPSFPEHTEEDDESKFSAYAASLEPPQPAPSNSAARFLSEGDPPFAGDPLFPAQDPPNPPAIEPLSVFRQESPRIPAQESPKGASGTVFPQKINSLSPLKQAVVLAEILGPPKGF